VQNNYFSEEKKRSSRRTRLEKETKKNKWVCSLERKDAEGVYEHLKKKVGKISLNTGNYEER